MTPNGTRLTFHVPITTVQRYIKIDKRIAAVGEVTDRRRDANDFIVCPMLCMETVNKHKVTRSVFRGKFIDSINFEENRV